jgi:hypothetical protein
MAYLRIALIALACIATSSPQADMAACKKLAEDTLAEVPPPTAKNIQTGATREQHQDAVARVFASMLTECAKRECKRDVRECIKVRKYEDAEKRLR